MYDKQIILGKGEDTIPFGFNWSPPDNSNLPNRALSNGSSVDLMDTDSEYDNDYSSENSCDRDFVDDDEIQSEQDVSFYRRLDKSL